MRSNASLHKTSREDSRFAYICLVWLTINSKMRLRDCHKVIASNFLHLATSHCQWQTPISLSKIEAMYSISSSLFRLFSLRIGDFKHGFAFVLTNQHIDQCLWTLFNPDCNIFSSFDTTICQPLDSFISVLN